jgi:hypothetical protein
MLEAMGLGVFQVRIGVAWLTVRLARTRSSDAWNESPLPHLRARLMG